MKHEKLSEALNQISDRHISEAAACKRRPHPAWLGAVAAVLALVIFFYAAGTPLAIQAKAVSTADYPKYVWTYLGNEMDTITPRINRFFKSSMTQTLSAAQEENMVYSPINLYMALSLGAELTAGTTRQQILDVLATHDLSTLRQQTNTLWNACYYDEKNHTLLANSLWLDKDLSYNQEIMDLLADNYYTDVYQGNFGSDRTDKAVTGWLNEKTGGLLKESTQGIDLDPETVLTAYSTVFFRAMWTESSEFAPRNNTDGVFHAPDGDRTVTFMNKKEHETSYYWGSDFGAVCLGLRDGSRMWFILPDEGKTAQDVIQSGEYLPFVLGQSRSDTGTESGERRAKVNISVPKFDIRVSSDLKEDLQALGITDVFSPGTADFSASVESSSPVYLSGVNQATRVAIDEEGVTAASYIELPGVGAAPPPDEIIDFIVDRPFVFVIANRYNVPLFAGVVNEP